LARLAQGQADDLLTTLCLATRAPIVIAPAMNQGMWRHSLTQENVERLKQKNIQFLGPDEGSQACGDMGPGRMMAPSDIAAYLSDVFATGLLSGRRVLVSAGPTHEAIDPVRFMTNYSSGKMGFALAEAAFEAGAKVTLISGPVSLSPPKQTVYLPVVSAEEMYLAVMKNLPECDIFLAVAAVGDYRAETIAPQKIHKNEEALLLKLVRNPDIVLDAGKLLPKPFIVGFAAETENMIANAKLKRARKNMDIIIANKVSGKAGMGTEDNAVTVIGKDWEVSIPSTPKDKLARQLITLIGNRFNERKT
jgi:phosphopantothenoylcysteine decarboxylase / phosphopantothenate---cysteine ligase